MELNISRRDAALLGVTPKSLLISLAIGPGFINTEMTEVLSEKVKEGATAQIPLGKFGETEDIANAAAFLASDEARYITGQTLHVDGGMAM